MSSPKVYDELSGRSARADGEVASLLAGLPDFVSNVSLTRDDELPLVEVWVAPELLMTPARAVAIGEALERVAPGAVDFFRLRQHSVAFFVYSPAFMWPAEVPSAMRRRCSGYPFPAWRDAFLAPA